MMILIAGADGKPRLVPFARATEKPQDGRSYPKPLPPYTPGPQTPASGPHKRE